MVVREGRDEGQANLEGIESFGLLHGDSGDDDLTPPQIGLKLRSESVTTQGCAAGL